jgi:hypothetical protein
MGALARMGRDEAVVFCPDDLSCGPIDSGDPQQRAEWWDYHPDDWDIASELRFFWDSVTTNYEHLVVWFARHSTMEYAFYLDLSYRLQNRPYDVVDVTGFQHWWTRRDGSRVLNGPAQAVSLIPDEGLALLLDAHRPMTDCEKVTVVHDWTKLKQENAPFRVLTPDGLVSAPIDYFDSILLATVPTEPQKMARIIGHVLFELRDPFIQVGDEMLHVRMVSLIESGALLATGDPRNIHECRVWRNPLR